MTVDENIRDAASISDAQPHSIAFAFGGVFPHYKGDSNTTKLTILQIIQPCEVPEGYHRVSESRSK